PKLEQDLDIPRGQFHRTQERLERLVIIPQRPNTDTPVVPDIGEFRVNFDRTFECFDGPTVIPVAGVEVDPFLVLHRRFAKDPVDKTAAHRSSLAFCSRRRRGGSDWRLLFYTDIFERGGD